LKSYFQYKTCKKNWKLNSMKSARHFWKQCTHHFRKFKSIKNYYQTKVYSDQELLKGKSSTLLTSQHSEKHLNQMIYYSQSYSKHTKAYWKSSIWCTQIWLKMTIIQRYDTKTRKLFWKNQTSRIIQFWRHTESLRC